ncbi:MAG: DUF4162 domain-containing protein, partial [Actinomycetota bacterium]
EGTTVLLTTQYLEEADALTDSITVIDQGRVIAEGTSDQLKSSIGSSHLTVTPERSRDLPAAAAAIERVIGVAPHDDHHAGSIRVPVTEGVNALLECADALRRAGVDVADIAIQRPSLDDVFLSITGVDPSKDGLAGEGAGS